MLPIPTVIFCIFKKIGVSAAIFKNRRVAVVTGALTKVLCDQYAISEYTNVPIKMRGKLFNFRDILNRCKM